jgi:hypothetical protein
VPFSRPRLRRAETAGCWPAETDEEILAWIQQHGRKSTEVDVQIWNGFAAKRGWRDEATAGLEKNKADSGLGTARISSRFSTITKSTRAAPRADPCRFLRAPPGTSSRNSATRRSVSSDRIS